MRWLTVMVPSPGILSNTSTETLSLTRSALDGMDAKKNKGICEVDMNEVLVYSEVIAWK